MTITQTKSTLTVVSNNEGTFIVNKHDFDNPSIDRLPAQALETNSDYSYPTELPRNDIRHSNTIGYQIVNLLGEHYKHESHQLYSDYNDAKLVWGIAFSEHDPRAELFDEPFWYIHQVRASDSSNLEFIKYDYRGKQKNRAAQMITFRPNQFEN